MYGKFIVGCSLRSKMRISSHAPNRKRQMKVRFTHHFGFCAISTKIAVCDPSRT